MEMQQHTEILPFFPLSVFLFPGEDIPLRIFEPRYKQLMEDIKESGKTFVIPFILDQQLQEFGCEVILDHVVAEHAGGRMVVNVRAMAVVRILSFNKHMEGKLYAGGLVERMPDSEPVESVELKILVREYAESFDHNFLSCCSHREFTRQDVMKALNLPSDDKYRFQCMHNGQQKEQYLSGQLRYLVMIRRQESLLDNDFGLN